MNARIIAGSRGGRTIDAPGRDSTHVMSERGRNALFNSITHLLPGADVVDAFAGSGALGLEALSRGAGSAEFIEKDRIAAKIIRANIQHLGFGEVASCTQAPLSSWIESRVNLGLYDIVFADPPYHSPQFSTVHKLFGLLKPEGTMILSHPGKGEVPVQNGIVVVDNRSYGNLNLTYFRRNSA